MAKMRCRTCWFWERDWMKNIVPNRCGLHGLTVVDPDGEQVNLNQRGGCGYVGKQQYVQLEFNFS